MSEAAVSDAVFSQRDVLVKHEFLEFLFGELVDMRPIFNNDLDAMLIYTAISRHYLRDERLGVSDDHKTRLGVGPTTTLIAEWTKIPRETVRRKLNQLASRGFIERAARDEWQIVRREGQPVIRTEYASEWRRELNRITRFVKAIKDYV